MENYNVIWNRNCNCIISSLHRQANEECFLAKSKRKKAGYIMISLILLVLSSFYIFAKTVETTDKSADTGMALLLLLTVICGIIVNIMAWHFDECCNILRKGGSKGTLQKLNEEECIRDFYECYNTNRILSINFSDTRIAYDENYKSSKKLVKYTWESFTKTVHSDELIIDGIQIKTDITVPTIRATETSVMLQLPYTDENKSKDGQEYCLL